MNKCEEIQQAIGAHGLWKGRLKKAIETRSFEIQPSVVAQDNQCPFGKWLYGAAFLLAEKNSTHYTECKELHRRFHRAAADVLTLALAGKTQEANHALESGSEFSQTSSALTLAMVRWSEAPDAAKTSK